MPFPAATGLISAYLLHGSGVPSTTYASGPPVVTTDYAIYQDTATGLMYVWNIFTASWVALVGTGAPTSANAKLTADVSMTTANTFYDGPSVSLVAGTWDISATCSFVGRAGGNDNITAKVWDGTTVYSSSEVETTGASGPGATSTPRTIITLASTTTLKVSAATLYGGTTMKAATLDNGAGNNATQITAIKIS